MAKSSIHGRAAMTPIETVKTSIQGFFCKGKRHRNNEQRNRRQHKKRHGEGIVGSREAFVKDADAYERHRGCSK